jgi:NADH-quinone oxidoreductase subunit H
VYKLDKRYNEIYAIKLRFWEATNYVLKNYQLNISFFFITYGSVIIYLYLVYGNLLLVSGVYNEAYNNFCSIACFIALPILFLPFHIKIVIISFIFILIRANVPRYRFDQLLGLSWKGLLPVSISSLFVTTSLLYCFNGFISVM